MKRKTFLCFIVFTLCFVQNAYNQTTKGVAVEATTEQTDTKYRLLVIGISTYKNIPSLQYAHKDAIEFYNYMRRAYKDKLTDQNSKLILNENATAANIYSEGIEWLVQESGKDETIFIYFSGHGDVENSTINKHGFLLAYDSPKSVYMSGGAIGVEYLQSYINTLVVNKNAKVVLIADACRSGKLAGGASGATTTSAALQQQWENVTKILSSQPGEVSFEDVKWNSGGGVFTYYLVKGMVGFADKNKDNKITIGELERFLDNVGDETQNSQNPIIMGNKMQSIAFINDELLSFYKDYGSNNKTGDVAMATARGMEEVIKDPKLKEVYEKFNYAIQKKNLVKLNDNDTTQSAYDFYLQIENIDKGGIWDRNARRKLIGALQSRYTSFINTIIETGKISMLFSNNSERSIVVKEITYSLKLIKPDFPNYNNIVAASMILNTFNTEYETQQQGFTAFIPVIDSCIVLKPDNSLLYYIKGKIFGLLDKPDSAQLYYNTALINSPTFVPPLLSKSEYEFSKGNYENVIKMLSTAEISTKDISGYKRWHKIMINSLFKTQKTTEIDRYFVTLNNQLLDEKASSKSYIGLAFMYKWYRKEIDSTKNADLIQNEQKLITKALTIESPLIQKLNSNIQLESDSIQHIIRFYNELIEYYYDVNTDSTNIYYSKLVETQNVLCKLYPTTINYMELMGSYIGIEDFENALNVLDKMVDMGFKNFDMIEKSDGTEAFIKEKRYKKIKKRSLESKK